LATRVQRCQFSIYPPKRIRNRLDEIQHRFHLKVLTKHLGRYYSVFSLNNITTVALVEGIDKVEKMTLKQFITTLNAIHNGHSGVPVRPLGK